MSKKENVKEYEGTIESHSNGVQYVPFINQHIQQNGGCKITVNSTAEISSAMLNQISDLSKLQVQILDGLGDGNGHLRQKYSSTKYQNRTTYTGLEMQKIIGEIEYLESRVDKSLPTYDRAKQLYEVIASHFSYNHSFDQYKNGHLITASLRGITDYNEIGKKGLVCAGFSSLYSELCKRLDIDCEYVRGKGYGHDDGKAEKHVWNVLKIDGQIIPVDVTWKSCDFSNDWFGPSEEFQRRHVADEDEIYKQYNIPNSLKSTLNSTLTQDDMSTILSAIGITDAVHGYGYGIRALKRYLQTNEAVGFTRTDNARYNIQKIDSSVIRNYFEVMQQDILEAIEAHNQKYNGSGIASYKAFLQDGNYNHITSSNGARNLVKKYSITELNILDQIYPLTGREIQLSETFEKLSDTEIQTISRSILTMDSIYGRNAGIKALRRYMSTGSDLEFTRTGGTRDLMKKIPALPLKKYFEQMSRDMNHVIQIHDAKYPGAGMSSFNAFLQDGNYNHITSSNGARTIAQKYSIKELKILQKLWDYLREEEI